MAVISALFDKYALSHLSTHLSKVGLIDDLYKLVTSNIWWQNSQMLDPSGHLFRNDATIAYQSIEEKIFTTYSENPNKNYVAEKTSKLVSLAFLLAKIGQKAARIQPATLEALTRLGRLEQALNRSTNNPDPIGHGKSLIFIGFAAFQEGQDSSCTALPSRPGRLCLSRRRSPRPSACLRSRSRAAGSRARRRSRPRSPRRAAAAR